MFGVINGNHPIHPVLGASGASQGIVCPSRQSIADTVCDNACLSHVPQVEEALTIKNTDIAKELCLPPVKLHCSSKSLPLKATGRALGRNLVMESTCICDRVMTSPLWSRSPSITSRGLEPTASAIARTASGRWCVPGLVLSTP